MAALRKLADEVDLSSEDTSLEPSAKRRKVEKSASESDFFANLFEPTEAVAADEVDSYLSSMASISDILGFWKSEETTWPKLAQCARWPDGYCLFRPPALRQSGCFL